jgi:hypothetical protein
MSIEFENKYVVVKRDDIEKYLNSIAQRNMYRYLGTIEAARKAGGKKNNTYLVVNTDEPYAGEVARIMQAHGHFTPGGEIVVETEKANEPEDAADKNNGREFITKEQAIALLPNGENIHTFRQAGPTLIGADWEREDIIAAMDKYRFELTGPAASSMGHGMAFEDEYGLVFVETKE